MDKINVSLDEPNFTFLCKYGHLIYGHGYDKQIIDISKIDMISLSKGDVITKEIPAVDKIFNIAVQDIGSDLIKEIIRRSPVYSHLYYDI